MERQLGILQFNNNGLRIYLWVNIALLSTYLPAKRLCLRQGRRR